MSSTRFMFRAPAHLIDKLRRVADERDTTPSAVVRDLLQDALTPQNNNTAGQVVEDPGGVVSR